MSWMRHQAIAQYFARVALGLAFVFVAVKLALLAIIWRTDGLAKAIEQSRSDVLEMIWLLGCIIVATGLVLIVVRVSRGGESSRSRPADALRRLDGTRGHHRP